MPHRRPSSLPQASGRSVQSSENATILTTLEEFFRTRSTPAYLVGGFLRDSLRGTDTEDVDVAVAGDSLSLAQELAVVLGGALLSTLGGYLALAGHRSHLYQSNVKLAAYVIHRIVNQPDSEQPHSSTSHATDRPNLSGPHDG